MMEDQELAQMLSEMTPDEQREALNSVPEWAGKMNDKALNDERGMDDASIRELYSAAAELYKQHPWDILEPSHIISTRIKGPGVTGRFRYIQFAGNTEPGGTFKSSKTLHAYSTLQEAQARSKSNLEKTPPGGLLQMAFVPEDELMCKADKAMEDTMGLDLGGEDAHINTCLIEPMSEGRHPPVEAVRWLAATARVLPHFTSKLQLGWSEKKRDFERHELQMRVGELSVTMTYPAEPVVAPRRCCCLCGADTDLPRQCSGCSAVVYCGAECQRSHWKQAHKRTCALYKSLMQEAPALDLSKEFSFSLGKPCMQDCMWLESAGLHGVGLWQRSCSCKRSVPWGALESTEAWGLDGTLTPVDSALSLVSPLTSWTEYYHARGLSAESRAAILLTFPLTLYHFIEIENQARLQDEAGCYSSDCITVHYLGPERELDMLPLFKETANLLGGDKKLHVAMVGPEVSESLHLNHRIVYEHLTISFHRGDYSDIVRSLPKADLAVALNAGLEESDRYNWSAAVGVILEHRTSTYFTECTRTGCMNAEQELEAAGAKVTLGSHPNPFRSPQGNLMAQANFPWFVNGFAFGVHFSEA